MKLGQVMSFLDVGLVPEEYREEFQRKLGELRDAAPKVSLQGDAQGHRGRPRGAARGHLRVLRRGADRGRLDRPGLPRDAAGRARRRGQGPVPGRRRRGPRRHAEPGDDPAADEAGGAGARRQGDRRGGPGADLRGARLRARGPEPALAGAHLPRPPVHRRPRRRHAAVARARDRQRVRLRARVRGAQATCPRPSATGSGRSCSASSSAGCTATASSPATRTRATSCSSTTGAWPSWTSACSSA